MVRRWGEEQRRGAIGADGERKRRGEQLRWACAHLNDECMHEADAAEQAVEGEERGHIQLHHLDGLQPLGVIVGVGYIK